MPDGGAKEFLEAIQRDLELRHRLQEATLEDLVKAGRQQGYEFTARDLEDQLRQHGVKGGPAYGQE